LAKFATQTWVAFLLRGNAMNMNKEQVIDAIQRCAKKLKRTPNLRELRLMAGVTKQAVYRRFGCLSKALAASGLEAIGPGHNLTEATLLLDWAGVARKLGKIPSVNEYESTGRFTIMPFHSRYRLWTNIPEAFRRFARTAKLEKGVAGRGCHGKRQAGESAREERGRRAATLPQRAYYGGPSQVWPPADAARTGP
jgi:hypothetical protein